MAYRGFRLDGPVAPRDRIYYYVAVDLDSRCWRWLGALDKGNGYGRVQVDGSTGYAHRYSYEAFVGPVPEGLTLDHLCRNRACVNPDHLEPVTNRVNFLRGNAAGAVAQRRTACRNGHAYAEYGVIRKDGRRVCRICTQAYMRTYRERRAAARRNQWIARGMAERSDAA